MTMPARRMITPNFNAWSANELEQAFFGLGLTLSLTISYSATVGELFRAVLNELHKQEYALTLTPLSLKRPEGK